MPTSSPPRPTPASSTPPAPSRTADVALAALLAVLCALFLAALLAAPADARAAAPEADRAGGDPATAEPSSPGTPDAPAATLAAQREDLATARAYVAASRAFTPATRAAALAAIDDALRRPTPLSPAAFLVQAMAIPALARNGHDFLDTMDGWSPARRLPLRFAWFADGLVVARADPARADLLGARVTAIDGHAPSQVLATLARIDGGTDAYRRWNDGWVLEHPDLLHALGLAGRPDAVTLSLHRPAGDEVDVVVPAVPSTEVPHDLGRLGARSRDASPDEAARGWRNAVAAPADPFWLQDRARPFRVEELPALDALFVQFRGNLDAPGQPLAAFVREVRARLSTTRARHLVLDQRLNRGGNADLTEDLMREMGRWSRGRVVVLVGPETFSAGIVSAALVVHGAGPNALVVGDEVGDPLRWWSESATAVCLPHARYCLHGSTGLWDLQRGCAGEPGCYGDRFDARVDTLAPTVPAPLTIDDWIAGRDPALAAVARRLAATPADPGAAASPATR